MKATLDNRNLLIKLINEMNAYAAGYEAGKTSLVSLGAVDNLRNPPRQTA